MAAPTTKGWSIAATPLRTKRGERFTVTIPLPVDASVDWTGVQGTGQVRTDAGVLVHDFGTVDGTVVDGVTYVIFDADTPATTLWVSGVCYYADFVFWVSTTFGPRATLTYRLEVAEGPTNIP